MGRGNSSTSAAIGSVILPRDMATKRLFGTISYLELFPAKKESRPHVNHEVFRKLAGEQDNFVEAWNTLIEDLNRSNSKSKCVYFGTDFNHIEISDMDLRGIDLEGTELRRVHFIRCDLTGAQLPYDANLVKFKDCELDDSVYSRKMGNGNVVVSDDPAKVKKQHFWSRRSKGGPYVHHLKVPSYEL